MPRYTSKPGAVLGIVTVLLAGSTVKSFAHPDRAELVYVGSGRQNIYAFWLDPASGALTSIGAVGQVNAPSFLTVSPQHTFLYAISEGSTPATSLVSGFELSETTGQLLFLNAQATGGSGPCYVAMDPKGLDLLVANYGSGSVSVFPTLGFGLVGVMSGFVQDHGSSVNPQRQEGPHAHCIITDPDDHFAFACDLGLDKVMIFKLDLATGTLAANDPAFATVKPGSGPRHIAFHPNRRFAYVVNELSSTLSAFAYDRTSGALTAMADYPLLSEAFKGQNNAAEVAVHPSGKFVYASNRGENSIAVFACDPETGSLDYLERDSTQGKTPRSFEIDPTGALLLAANQDSGTIVVFRIDKKTGRLEPTGNSATADMPMCVKCIQFAK
jgi:6-phosphogluconolactonase